MDFYNKTPEELAAFYTKAMNRINKGDGYANLSHIVVTKLQDRYAEGELTITPETLNPRGIVHGGCLATLADTVSGVAAHSTGLGCVTLNCTMNFLRPATGKKVYCRSRVEKTGRTIQVCQATLLNDQGETVATGTFTFYAVGPLELPE